MEKQDFLEALESAYGERKMHFFGLGGAVLSFLAFSALALASAPLPFTHYFLSVGQGDSEAVMLQGGMVALVDGGPANGRAVRELERVLPFYKRSVDIIFLTHPEEDHFGGLIEILKRYKVGVVLTNGDANDTEVYYEFTRTMEQKNIKAIALSAGDKVRAGDIELSVLWPLPGERSNQPNENALVLLGEFRGNRSLLAADIPDSAEKRLAETVPEASLLKVAHHGSKFSSDEDFLYAVNPVAAVVEVGKNNYGHPSPEALSRLSTAGAEVFRTDRDGTLGARFEGNILKIFSVKMAGRGFLR